MRNFFLYKVRLTNYFLFFLGFYAVIALIVDKVPLDKAALTLFSANSFLYGFYISPIVKSQNDRIDKLHLLVRKEATKIYEIALYSKRLSPDYHIEIIKILHDYIRAVSKTKKHTHGEKEFQDLMTTLIVYSSDTGKDQYKEIMKASFAIQQNRSELDMYFKEKVYRNEWIVMFILFSITITFISIIEIPDIFFLQLIPPVLCTGLTMLIVILMKKSSLAHKKAKSIWLPMQELANTNFYKINSK